MSASLVHTRQRWSMEAAKLMGWAEAVPLEMCTKCGNLGEAALGMLIYDPRVDRRWICQVCK